MKPLNEMSLLEGAPSPELRPRKDGPGAKLAEGVLNLLAEDRELTFYDRSYPNPGHPGAYVSVRACAGAYFYRHATRYGRLGRWRRVRRERLIEYLDQSVSASDDLLLRRCAASPWP